MTIDNRADCVSRRGCDAFVVEFLKVDFNVDKIVLVCLAIVDVEPDFRLVFLQDRTLQLKERMLCKFARM